MKPLKFLIYISPVIYEKKRRVSLQRRKSIAVLVREDVDWLKKKGKGGGKS